MGVSLAVFTTQTVATMRKSFMLAVIVCSLTVALIEHLQRPTVCQPLQVQDIKKSTLIRTKHKAVITSNGSATAQVDGSTESNISLSCVTPKLDAFDRTVMPFLKKVGKVDCHPFENLVSEVNETGFLILYSKRLQRHIGRNTKSICFYNSFVRIHDNKRIHWRRNLIIPDQPVQVFSDFIRVTCYAHKKLVYINIHATISDKRTVMKKLQSTQSNNTSLNNNNHTAANEDKNEKGFSVLMIAFDGMSRSNTIRQLPKTYEYITNEMGAITLKSYNVVGDNSFPNIMPLLCGISRTEFPKKPGRIPTTIPLIWKKFSDKGYVTLYTEDKKYATFNYLTTGFGKAPTDYYQRPFWEEVDVTNLRRKNNGLKPFKEHCFNGITIHQLMLDWVKSFTKKFSEFPYFSFSFLNHLSHNSINDIQISDDYLLRFFKTLHKNGYLRNTITMFLSDHGNRYGAIRQTPIGRAEHALPLMSIYFPDNFKKQHPDAVKAVQKNSNRLTTPYDIHATLLDVLNNNFSFRHYRKDGRGLSLFGTIPNDRNCKTCGIPDEFCKCAELYPVPTKSSTAQKATIVALNWIRMQLEPRARLCKRLVLNRIFSASQNVNGTMIVVIFETLPGLALFEAKVQLPSNLQSSNWKDNSTVIGNVGRINKYGDQSSCVHDSHLRLYCYCKRYKGKLKK